MASLGPYHEPRESSLGTQIILLLAFEYYSSIYAYVSEVVSPSAFFEPVVI
jgi:hypothetical protein